MQKYRFFKNAPTVRLLYHSIAFLCALAYTHCESIRTAFLCFWRVLDKY
ncbi:hypothetical protein HMPREF0860_1973 [Treponema socranskii subsp. socranskii VPI DR56BR1116 = ATCC 35536]|uniref:Uncharacterized protein n=1 Tax=Treponema socranskii subsp. socranskii VPI DR56BR1116 = ATCC 35536 TaxID=1125725 RepID=U1FM11_TRESO|nr:hypothetical protein HMPREF1325_0102 [Treponema socranskii subsp. socranskii VPI DR56BR1116 = ATCC 35536]ERK01312.1 hypothetical protein HMPREF0860_1973 [Treponema socranskii subsp. socranskii VPI DR56BR1116 = ATCC 35536]